jgi:hypothetical protein
LYDTLFGDKPLEKWAHESHGEPWVSFVNARDAIGRGEPQTATKALLGITSMQGLESRHHLQAWHALRGLGVIPPAETAKNVLGVVVEVALDEGLDLLAAYADHSARYWNYAGGGVVWDAPNTAMDAWIDRVLSSARAVVVHIGPWGSPRRPPPSRGDVRLNILTPGGLCFGEGPFDALAKDAMGGPLIAAAGELMQQLMRLPKRQ